MTVLYSLKKRGVDVTAHLKDVLDELAKDIHQDPFALLFLETAQHPNPVHLFTSPQDQLGAQHQQGCSELLGPFYAPTPPPLKGYERAFQREAKACPRA